MGDAITGRCMRCKENKEMKDVEISLTKNGARMAKGTCVDCNCKMAKILPKEKPAE